MSQLLDEFVDGIILLDSDKDALIKDRGFTPDVIEKYKFRSCQPDNVRRLATMAEKYGANELAGFHLYSLEANGISRPQRQLLEPRVLIPYLDKDFSVTKIRPHKLGFPNDPARVYRTISSYERSSTCVIAESEFKAVAAECFGHAAIGIPGITSMSSKNWDYFLGVLRDIRTDAFVICFDNEIKGDPSLPAHRYKKDWRQRYNTIVYAYVMCQKILSAGFSCRIATLPKDWMVDGKIDIDQALALYRSTGEDKYKLKFDHIILNAVHPKDYWKTADIPPEHQHYTTRLMRADFISTPLIVKDNCFFTKVMAKKPEESTELKKLTNCTVYVKNVYEHLGSDESSGVKRDLAIIDEYGIETMASTISAANMASRGAFGTWLMGQGNFLFYGNDADVVSIWEYVFAHDASNVVYMMDRCGYIKEQDGFMFRNCFIKNGEVAEADDNGIIWMDNVGYKPSSLVTGNDEVASIPYLGTDEENFDLGKYIECMGNTVDSNERGQGKAMVAWALAVPFMEAIHAKFKLFPIMFMYGTRGSGKTTIMRWLGQLFGIGTTYSLAMTSAVGIIRVLGYYSGLPVLVDDWRDDDKCRRLVTTFLGVYNRQTGAKGVKSKFGITQSVIRGALLLGGEEMIADNALATRCVSFYIPPTRIKQSLDEMEHLLSKHPGYMRRILLDQYVLAPKVMEKIEDSVKRLRVLVGPNVENRILFNYAVCLGAYRVLAGDDAELEDYMAAKIKFSQAELAEGDKVHRFAQEFSFGVSQNIISNKMFKYDAKTSIITLYVSGINDVMNKYYNRLTNSAQLIIKHLSQQPYYIGAVAASYPGVMGRLPSIKLDLSKMSESMRMYYSCAQGGYGETGS